MDWNPIRRLFVATQTQAYLNTATYGPGPRTTVERVEESVRAWQAGRGDWREWEAAGARSRELFGRLIGARADDVALLPTLAIGAGLVAAGLRARPNANLVVGEAEFRSNLFPWLMQERRGFEIRAVPFREGGPRVEDVVQRIDGNTALVALSSVQSASGFRLDVSAVAAACRANGARLFVDGTQSVGALAFDAADVDFLGVAAYKWLLAPRGAAFLYIAPERRAELEPVFAGWTAPADVHASYYGGPLELADDASRFDASLAWIAWVGLAPSLELIDKLGIGAIEARVMALAAMFREGARALGLDVSGTPEGDSQIVSVAVPDPEALARTLIDAKVVAAVRDRYLRVSFHFFNDESDVERVLRALGSSGSPD